jgi:hypothetical protein
MVGGWEGAVDIMNYVKKLCYEKSKRTSLLEQTFGMA